MKVILCISNNNGMMFNNRRQSKDTVLLNRIVKMTKGGTLYIQKYSEKLFSNYLLDNSIIVFDDFDMLYECSEESYVFIEDPEILKDLKINEIIVCEWNRDYPADKFFKMDLSNFDLYETENLIGSSHDEITIKKYKR